jgi:YVTN family beta-propeller protein
VIHRRSITSVALFGLALVSFGGRGRNEGSTPLVPVVPPSASVDSATPVGRAEVGGFGIELYLEPLRVGAPLQQGEEVRVRLQFTDLATKAPADGLAPGGWVDLLTPDSKAGDSTECKRKLAGFVSGSVLHPPEHDLNTYYVLALNEDSTITVVDPLFGFGGTKLLEMVFLKGPGDDWALAKDKAHLFVSMPEIGEVAVVDTASWKVVANVPVGVGARRLALQDDGRYLWVAVDRGSTPGVAAIDTTKFTRVAFVPTVGGVQDLAFSTDDTTLFVTHLSAATVSVIDVRTARKVRDVAVGKRPISIAYSALSAAAFVACEDGTISVVDADSPAPVATMTAEPGLAQIRFAPNGRLAFVANPTTDHVHILDAATRRLVQTAEVEDEPDQISFTAELAYVRHRGSDTVLMIPLAEVGKPGGTIPVIDFPGGQNPPGDVPRPTPAAGIVSAPGETAVLVANPLDQMIYFYKEGMAAPMGSFKNYSRQPRAVMALNRSLGPAGPGRYETTITLGKPGRRDLAILVNSPRLTHCFPFEVAANPNQQERRAALSVEARVDQRVIPVGHEVMLRFQLTETATKQPASGLSDVYVTTFLSPGMLRRRTLAQEASPGLYQIPFTPPESGAYFGFVEVLSKGLRVEQSPPLVLEAVDPAAEGSETGGKVDGR